MTVIFPGAAILTKAADSDEWRLSKRCQAEPWIGVRWRGTDGEAFCRPCGKTLPIHAPIAVDTFLSTLKAFRNEHDGCKPKAA